jgi:peptidyl-prolyl cis-trans isomerase D
MAKQPTPKVVSKKHLARLERENLQKRYLLIGTIVVVVLVFGVIIYGILDQTVLAGIKPVAKVGNQTITTNEFVLRTSYERSMLVQQFDNTAQFAQSFGQDPTFASYFASSLSDIQSRLSDPVTFGNSVLDNMVDDILIANKAKELNITVSDAEIDTALHDSFGYYPNGTPTPSLTPTEFSTPTLSLTQQALISPTPSATVGPTLTLEPSATPLPGTPTPEITTTPTIEPSITPTLEPSPTATPYTLEGYNKVFSNFVTQLKTIKYTEKDVRALVATSLLRKKVFDVITKDLKPEEEQVWARHILVKDEATAQDVEKRLKAGEDFAALAKELSQDTSNKDSGGDLGWFGRGKMVAPFEDAAFKLGVGQISDPVKSDFGYHIIQVLGHEVRPLSSTDFDTLKQTTFTNWLKTASDAITINRYADTVSKVAPATPAISPEGLQFLQQLQALQQQQQQQQQAPLPTLEPATPEPTPKP